MAQEDRSARSHGRRTGPFIAIRFLTVELVNPQVIEKQSLHVRMMQQQPQPFPGSSPMCPCWGPGRERGCGGAWLRPRCRLARRTVGARNRAREGPLEAELTTRALQGSFARVAAGGNLGSSPRLHTTIQVPFPPADSISPGPGALPLSPRAKLPNPATVQQYPTLARRKLELCHDSSIFLLSSPGSASLGVDRVEACMEFHGGRLTSVLVQPFSRADLPGTPSRDDRANNS
jgi:hypothetical protein